MKILCLALLGVTQKTTKYPESEMSVSQLRFEPRTCGMEVWSLTAMPTCSVRAGSIGVHARIRLGSSGSGQSPVSAEYHCPLTGSAPRNVRPTDPLELTG
jgi:hypothetical protein